MENRVKVIWEIHLKDIYNQGNILFLSIIIISIIIRNIILYSSWLFADFACSDDYQTLLWLHYYRVPSRDIPMDLQLQISLFLRNHKKLLV